MNLDVLHGGGMDPAQAGITVPVLIVGGGAGLTASMLLPRTRWTRC